MTSEEKIKDDVLNQLSDQIKALQLKQINETGGDEEFQIKCSNIHVKCLFDVLDHILLYGLKSPENGYWSFVCEFTHPEVKKDVNESPDVHSAFDKGRLWIYLSLLDCLLGSYFRMFFENQKTPAKYYQRNSFIRDRERLGIIITLIAGLDVIRLSSELDLSFLGLRDVGLTGVIGNGRVDHKTKDTNNSIPLHSFSRREDDNRNEVVSGVSTPGNGNVARSRESTSVQHIEPSYLEYDSIQPDISVVEAENENENGEGKYFETLDWLSINKSMLFEDRARTFENASDGGDSFDEFCHPTGDGKSFDSSDLADISTISLVEAESSHELAPKFPPNNLQNSHQRPVSAEYEGIVLAGFPRRPTLSESLSTLSDVMMKHSVMKKLSFNILTSKDEKCRRITKGFTGFHYGRLHEVHLLLTDESLYFLRKQTNESFALEQSIKFSELKHVEIGVNCQHLVFLANKIEKYPFSTANEAVTRSLVSDISSLVMKSLSSPSKLTLLVSSTAVQGQQAITRWLHDALGDQMLNLEIICFSLVHWMCFSGPGSDVDTGWHQVIKEGFLDCKTRYLGMVSLWEKNYFVLTGRGLLQFAKHGDLNPKMVYKLNGSSCGGCRRVSDEEKDFTFEIVSSEGESMIMLSSSTEDQASDWIIKLCQTVAGSSEFLSHAMPPSSRAIPCCSVITKQSVVTFHAFIQGQFRFLSSFYIENITQILVDNEVRNYCILKFESEHEGMWYFAFATEYELSKFEHAIAEAWKERFQADLQFYIIGEGPTRRRARNMSNYIQNVLYG